MSKSIVMIIDEDGNRLCKDQRWRGFASYGTTTGCVRTYQKVSTAKRTAKKLKARIVEVISQT